MHTGSTNGGRHHDAVSEFPLSSVGRVIAGWVTTWLSPSVDFQTCMELVSIKSPLESCCNWSLPRALRVFFGFFSFPAPFVKSTPRSTKAV